jgi:endonuclease/exonuclease/phosphatase family metal-dependent hydrolase
MTELTLASFNTHYGMRPGRTPGLPYDMRAALRSLDAEVLAIQEVWRPDGEAGVVDVAAAELGYTVHHLELGRATVRGRWPHADPDGEGTIGVAVLTRGEARVIGPIVVGPTLGDPIPERAVLHSELALGDDATPLQLVAVHLSSRLPHAPPVQLSRLARAVPPPGVPAVVAGDCNFWGPGVRTFFRGWTRAVRGRTWPAARPHSQIDHVLVRRDDVEVLDGRVLPDVGSDHRPVRVVLRVRAAGDSTRATR